MNRHFLMIRKNLDALPENNLPEGYRFAVCTEKTAGDYAKIIDESFEQPHSNWFEQVTKKHGYFPGATVIVYCGDEPVATATALCDKSDGNTEGYLHMVGALKSHKGKRLGYEVTLKCLHIMREMGMRSCRLDTDEFRVPAVITYLKLGFMPEGLDEDYRVRWIRFFEETNHPDASLRDYVRRSPMPVTLEWRFQTDCFGLGEERGMFGPDYDDSSWKVVRFPIDNDSVSDMNGHYDGVSWYRRKFDSAAALGDSRLFFDFTGVCHRCKVWVNGHLCAERPYGFLPFTVDATPYLLSEGQNTLAVMVDNSLSAKTLPSNHIGWRNFGGITREVYLRTAPQIYVPEFEAATDMTSLTYRAKIEGAASPAVWTLTIEKDGACVARASGSALGEVSGRLSVQNPKLWSPDSPELYVARLSLENGYAVEKKVGFRKFERRGAEILLNGKPLKLFGFNRHEDGPEKQDKRTAFARKDLLKIKNLGCNFVRLCHYPHSPEVYGYCDELGLISWAEIPLYWNGSEGTTDCQDRIFETAKVFAADMVRELKSRPSVAFWSVSNESREELPAVAEVNRELLKHIKALIPGGFAVHVSDRWLIEKRELPLYTEDDVICVNGYPCVLWDRKDRGEIDPGKGTAFWKTRLAELKEKYPDKPILVTEFGYPAIPGAHDQYWSEEEQARIVPAEAAAIAECENVAGMAVWCWADHLWPDSLSQKLPTSPFGVVLRSREPKQVLPALGEFAKSYLGGI